MALVNTAGQAVPEADVKGFGAAFTGTLLASGDTGYDDVRRIWNGMIDRRPGLIARCAGTEDVARAVNFARDHELLVAIRGGGHSLPGFSVCDGGLMIDLSPMKGITVDPAARRARAQGGLVWGEFDAATQEHGLAVTGGQVTHTGIAGLTLGSGLGWLMRNFGLTPDNVEAFEIVTADGTVRRVSAGEHPDLYWALRGGGGNFGVVTTFDYRLHPVGPIVTAGLVAYPLPEAVTVVGGWRDYVADVADELTSGIAMLTTPDGHPAVAVLPCHSGDLAAGEQVTAPLRKLGTAVLDEVGPMPYVAMQSIVDPAVDPGRRYYQRASFLPDVPDDLIGILAQQKAKAPSPGSVVLLFHLGGAVARVAPDATAFPHRQMPFYTDILACWDDPADDDANIGWIKETWTAIAPYLGGGHGVDVNHLDRGEDRVREAYGAGTYERLQEVKRVYDPDNLFRLNQNIKP